MYRISMDAILFLETIVHLYSYTRYKVLHMGRSYHPIQYQNVYSAAALTG